MIIERLDHVLIGFLSLFAMTFGTQSRLRKEALGKMEEVMAKEHELLSLGGQAAAAAHSLGTPLSTITIIAHDVEIRKHVVVLKLLLDGRIKNYLIFNGICSLFQIMSLIEIS